MPTRRGLEMSERLALNSKIATATSTIVTGPSFVYQYVVSMIDSTTTGDLVLGNTTASAAVNFAITGDAPMGVIRFGATGISAANNQVVIVTPPKPLYFSKGIAVSATNCQLSVSYLDG